MKAFTDVGVITGARSTEYLLEKSRIVTQASDERNYHVFYEMLSGLSDTEKEKYGLQSADNYFYLNQGGCFKIKSKDDAEDFRALLAAMQVLSFTSEEQDTIFRILASVLHLGNIYFHRKQLKHGQEGVEIGSDAEIRWASHLLQLSLDGILRAMTTKTTEARNERVVTPLNIDQALDARDAIAKALYSSLFSWLVQRVNNIVFKGPRKTSIAILDIFGFEDFKENSFEQLCINYANETLQYYFNKHVFKLEQQEYAKERIEWQPVNYQDNQPVLNLIAKKPVGILPLLDDESNFPKATDLSFLEKCHYNHALNELYSRPRMSSMEFGVKHYAGQVWYSVDGFLDKNRDTLRGVVVELLISSKLPMISKMFQELRDTAEAAKTISKSNGRFVTMKPRTPTVGARFHDSLQSLVDQMAKCHPWFVRCIKPNNEKAPMKFDMLIVLEQLRYSGMLETISIRKTGYPIRMKFQQFAERYRCIVPGRLPRGSPSRDVCRVILDKIPGSKDQYQLGSSKVFLRESLEQALEKERVNILRGSVVTIQRYVRGYQARKKYKLMRHSAVKIQTSYRAWTARRSYRIIRKGIIRTQANYRMLRQKREYDKIKAILARKREADRLALERSKERANKEEQERASRAVAGVNHLEIPAELAFIFSKLDEWQCIHNERNVSKVVGEVAKPFSPEYRLPSDIDQHAFTKFTNVYFKAHIWGMKREPIKTPFLAKTNESDYQCSLALFKLILRFMNDNNLSGKKERILGDYIVQKGLLNETMRDEILCQLCNQTWKNDNEANNERAWILMANCLSCFAPSRHLCKYLLKYVSDHAYDGYKAHCQRKLLQGQKLDPEGRRTYPPSLLEWKSNTRRTNMALEAKFADGGSMYGPVESLTTGEEFAASLLKARGIDDCYGWTVDLDDDGDLYELNGYDYVLDLIAETEVPPAFPVCKSFFLVSANKNKKTKYSSATWAASPHNPERINTFEIDIDESPPAPIRYKQPIKSRSIDDITRADQHSSHEYLTRERRKERIRSSSHERLLDDIGRIDPPLSKTSALNDRYFENGKTTRSDLIVEETSRSRSRPEPIGSMLGLSKSKLNERYTEREVPGLSETSKLNKRYLAPKNNSSQQRPEEDLHHSKTAQSPPSSAWQDELGLASSALNDRYFSRQELLKQTKTDASDAGSRRGDGSVIHGPTPSIDESSKINGHSPDMNGSGNNRDASNSSQASNDGIDFPEFDFPENGDEEEEIEPDDFLPDPDGSRCSRTTESTRYVKYSGKQQAVKGHSHSTKAHIDRNRDDYSSVGGPKSSAMSDTSEAPSLASHVKNVRIPSHTSDLDQYLDDLFNPVLDGNLDELSDARSLAASIKGGRGPEPLSVYNKDSSEIDPYNILDELLPEPPEEEFSNLNNPESLAKALKGGGKAVGGGIDTQQRGAPNGLHSQSMTPNMSTPSPALPGGVGNSSASSTTGGSNLPLYNLSGRHETKGFLIFFNTFI
ncbi:Unconventional myosin-XV [Araneus ventricosus]|uniref:Unconventional myosin-XV n=1 Tax=Araneus ventricosus TaxID=182803 RepID=A0A4Y2DTA6_ARAVE|nr:Unconventional myosin-XV [Araneus ventricosus]